MVPPAKPIGQMRPLDRHAAQRLGKDIAADRIVDAVDAAAVGQL